MTEKFTENKGRPLTAEELSVFCLKLAMMIRSGISVERSVSILTDDAGSDADRALLSGIYERVAEGRTLAQALEQVGRFPAHMIRMLEIGQVTGKQDAVLSSLTDFYRREAGLSRTIRNAVVYPVVMLIVTAVILFVLVSRVLPVFRQVFRDMAGEVPSGAAALWGLGEASKTLAVGLGVFFVVCVGLAGLASLSPRGRAALGRFTDRVLFGNRLRLAVSRSRFASAMSLMLSSGLNIGEALERSEKLIGYGAFAGGVRRCKDRIEAGADFPKAAEEAGVFTGMQAGLLSAGFRSGVTAQAMREVSGLCVEDSDALLFRMINRIEPALVVILAFSVGLVLLSVMLPLIGMMTAIGV